MLIRLKLENLISYPNISNDINSSDYTKIVFNMNTYWHGNYM